MNGPTFPAPRPRLAILFWCYKDVDLCVNRVRLLRRFNPFTPIYVVYGGASGLARSEFGDAMRELVDDFYAFDRVAHPIWRWLSGDLMLVEWFRSRGHRFEWDTVVVVQWDMLVAQPVDTLFGDLACGEVLLSGLRPVSTMLDWWGWVSPHRGTFYREFEEFVDLVRQRYGFTGEPFGCIFIVVCLPRAFMVRLAEEGIEDGFIEYRVPVLAQAFGFPFARHERFRPWAPHDPDSAGWRGFRRRALNGVGQEVSRLRLACELALPRGFRVFHPVRYPIRDDTRSLLVAVLGSARS